MIFHVFPFNALVVISSYREYSNNWLWWILPDFSRCRKPDCSNPNARLTFDSDDSTMSNGRLTEDEGEREGNSLPGNSNNFGPNETGNSTTQGDCTIWNFPWAIALFWCLGILVLALMISHCIICSSLVCKCIRTEVEEREPSIYEGATDYSQDNYDKRHPYRIEYDNRDIYKTSNNYDPYCLESDTEQTEPKRRRHKKSQRLWKRSPEIARSWDIEMSRCFDIY